LEGADFSKLMSQVRRVPGLVFRAWTSGFEPTVHVVCWEEDLPAVMEFLFCGIPEKIRPACLTATEEWDPVEIDTFRANFDVDRFLAHHFLLGLHGDRDRKRTKSAVEPNTKFFRRPELESALLKIPDLKKVTSNKGRILLGWKMRVLRQRLVELDGEPMGEGNCVSDSSSSRVSTMSINGDEAVRAGKEDHENRENDHGERTKRNIRNNDLE
jgi:hypothetical protein